MSFLIINEFTKIIDRTQIWNYKLYTEDNLSIQPPRLQEQFDLVDDPGQFFQDLLRPEAEDDIAHVPQCTVSLLIFLHVALDLGNPEPPVGMDVFPAFLPVTAVPELPVHEDGQAVFPDHDVRPAGQGAVMQAVADVPSPQSPPEHHLRSGVLAFDPGHIPASLRSGVEPFGFRKAGDMDAIFCAVVTWHRVKLRYNGNPNEIIL